MLLNIVLAPVNVAKGDVNGDGSIDLKDLILSLRILTDNTIFSQAVCKGADVNGDNRIGIEEVIYILQKAAGLR